MTKCYICHKKLTRLSSHIYQSHHISVKNYYDKYFKKSDEGICTVCKNSTHFYSLKRGYLKYCSRKCGCIINSQIKAHKICIKCFNPFVSLSNVQKKCLECRKKKCLNCGADIVNRKFCNHKCRAKFYKEKSSERLKKLRKTLDYSKILTGIKHNYIPLNKLPHEIRICPICKTSFEVKITSKKVCCSPSCGVKYQIKRGLNYISIRDSNSLDNRGSWGRANFREDLNQYFRSTWEANFARICNYLNIEWEYEICRFKFNNCTYLPDFYLPQFDIWVEVKGWLSPKAYEKLEKMNKEYLNENIKIIDIEVYRILSLMFKDRINNWELT